MNLRKYGKEPYKIAVIHGGPGGAGGVKPLAEELSKICGVLEPLQTEMSVGGQIEELKRVLEENVKEPITLIGHSWGAMLIYMFASKYSHMVKKIILVSSGPFEEKYFPDLCGNREDRLTTEEKAELDRLRSIFANPGNEDMDNVFSKFGKLMGKLDSYMPIEIEEDISLCSYEIFTKVWPEAHAMRKRGEMYEMGRNIECEVVAIHGDYDSHPIEGIRDSLDKIIKNFKFYELKKCGHTPWAEVYAKDEFYKILQAEI